MISTTKKAAFLIRSGHQLERVSRSVALLGFLGLLLIALLTFYDGTARYLGWVRLSGFTDYTELFYPIVIASCFPALLLRKSNITIQILGKSMGQRGHAWLEVFAALLTLLFFLALAWQLVEMTIGYSAAGRTTPTIEIAITPWWWIATSIMALCVPVQLYVFIYSLVAALRRPSGQ
jgi:TRAP-type C4-dicarboxylate transport system permease small subunit